MQTAYKTEVKEVEFYATLLDRKTKKRFATCQVCEGSGIEFDEERPGTYARVCPRCNGEGWVVK